MTLTNNYPNITQDQLDAIALLMNDSIREDIHSKLADCHPGQFLTAYIAVAPEFTDVLKQFNVG